MVDDDTALAEINRAAPDLVILDIGLPLLDGFEVLSRARGQGISTPVVVLTARDSVRDTVTGLTSGANDYLAKPFHFAELLARVQLRLHDGSSTHDEARTLEHGGLRLDLLAHTAEVDGYVIEGHVPVQDIQRLLAYSSIANIGYALLGIAAGTAEGLQAMLMFMTLYVIDQLGFFAILLSLSKSGRPIRRIADLAGLKKDRPVTAVALTVLSLSVLGMPPFSGFWGKYYVFGAAADAGLWPVAAAGLVASVVAAFYYLRLIKVMWFDDAKGEFARTAGELRLVFGLSGLFVLGYVLIGGPLGNAAEVAARTFF